MSGSSPGQNEWSARPSKALFALIETSPAPESEDILNIFTNANEQGKREWKKKVVSSFSSYINEMTKWSSSIKLPDPTLMKTGAWEDETEKIDETLSECSAWTYNLSQSLNKLRSSWTGIPDQSDATINGWLKALSLLEQTILPSKKKDFVSAKNAHRGYVSTLTDLVVQGAVDPDEFRRIADGSVTVDRQFFAAKREFKKVAKEGEKTKNISWADMVEQDDEAEEARKVSETTKSQLLTAIRSKGGGARENRILIPSKLRSALPKFYDRLMAAAKLAKCELHEDVNCEVNLANPVAFGDNIDLRDEFLTRQYIKGEPNKTLHEIANLAVLIDSVLEIPDPNTACEKLGRKSLLHLFNLFLRIYMEQRYSVPISSQAKWYKDDKISRNDIIGQIQSQVGGQDVATCLINAFDILYRKFIRRILDQKGIEGRKGRDKLDGLADFLTQKLFCSGGTLFQRLLPSRKATKKIWTTSTGPKGQEVKTATEVEYKAFVKPHIRDGDLTATESAIYKKVNGALSKMDKFAVGWSLEQKNGFDSPIEWEAGHKAWIDDVRSRCEIPNSVLRSRHEYIRSGILEQRKEQRRAPGQGPSRRNVQEEKITPTEWKDYANDYIKSAEETMIENSIAALNQMLFINLNKDQWLTVGENELLDSLKPKFSPQIESDED
jgi:hypothetical protein